MIGAVIVSALLAIPVSAGVTVLIMKPVVGRLYEHLETLQKQLLESINKHML